MKNHNLPEIENLEQVVSQSHFLLTEGVYYPKDEKQRALFLFRQLGTYIGQLKTI